MNFRSLLRTQFYRLAFDYISSRVPRVHDSSYYVDMLAQKNNSSRPNTDTTDTQHYLQSYHTATLQ